MKVRIKHYSLVLNILRVTSVTMPDPQTSVSLCVRCGKWCQRFFWHHLGRLWILCRNNIL